jgi:hypothetical protein
VPGDNLVHRAPLLTNQTLELVKDINPEMQRQRLVSAIDKLNRATQLPRREGRDEHPSHLFNTLGTAYARYAKYLEEAAQDNTLIEAAWDSACDAFRKSIELLPTSKHSWRSATDC